MDATTNDVNAGSSSKSPVKSPPEVKANPIAKEKEDKTLEVLKLPVSFVGDKNQKDLGEVNIGNHSPFLEHGAVHYTSGGYNPTQSQNPTFTTSLDPTTSSTSVTPSPPMHKDPHPPTHTNPMQTTLHPHAKPNNTLTSIQHLETKFPLSFDTGLSIPDAPTPSRKRFSLKDKARKLHVASSIDSILPSVPDFIRILQTSFDFSRLVDRFKCNFRFVGWSIQASFEGLSDGHSHRFFQLVQPCRSITGLLGRRRKVTPPDTSLGRKLSNTFKLVSPFSGDYASSKVFFPGTQRRR
ncbi:hypothetical protein L6452_36905 [Arctium lappa]|uniref:Uncharacterized protein n=1 Tax=Arctium lappa TaxID=4217 RepID=A0ACB8Y5Q4_ARCLA|nr:hypothetical protein L6452_36905 [Arctium lappa]